MHDGIHVDKAGTPSVTICTDLFARTSRAMAGMWGAPDYPVIYTNHPVAPLTKEQLEARATEMMDQIVAILTGVEVSEPV